ncbi:MAG TPA: hypothetical protein DER33_07565 [Syntrophomonas sp.]|jgi:di/tricarboxylate transporter|nr:hypothetical protein [Syntrophomonas sp.]
MSITPLWWALSLGACLGGNGTIIGASANVIVSGISAREGHPITFLGYMKVAFPLMLLSIAICTVYCIYVISRPILLLCCNSNAELQHFCIFSLNQALRERYRVTGFFL